MGWFQTEPTEWVIEEESSEPVEVSFSSIQDGEPVVYTWTAIVDTVTKHKSGMTYFTAIQAKTSYLAQNPKHTAVVRRENAAGAYGLYVSGVTRDAWAVGGE